MDKPAKTIDEQIALLESRGLTIYDKHKAEEILLDIGYYRLGFYLFPFEKNYPSLKNRTHEYSPESSLDKAVRLYYFDFDLRLLLLRYLNRIEIAFRTAMIYHISNTYKGNNIWFVSPSVVGKDYASNFEQRIYTSEFKRNPVICRHHQTYPNDRFAPAWKTLEFMTFGAVLKLYEQLKDPADKIKIANQFGVRQIITFENYMHTIRTVRNACAHGLLLYDMKLPRRIRKGPAKQSQQDSGCIIGALRVIKYIVGQISQNRAKDMTSDIHKLYNELCHNAPTIKTLIPNFTLV